MKFGFGRSNRNGIDQARKQAYKGHGATTGTPTKVKGKNAKPAPKGLNALQRIEHFQAAGVKFNPPPTLDARGALPAQYRNLDIHPDAAIAPGATIDLTKGKPITLGSGAVLGATAQVSGGSIQDADIYGKVTGGVIEGGMALPGGNGIRFGNSYVSEGSTVTGGHLHGSKVSGNSAVHGGELHGSHVDNNSTISGDPRNPRLPFLEDSNVFNESAVTGGFLRNHNVDHKLIQGGRHEGNYSGWNQATQSPQRNAGFSSAARGLAPGAHQGLFNSPSMSQLNGVANQGAQQQPKKSGWSTFGKIAAGLIGLQVVGGLGSMLMYGGMGMGMGMYGTGMGWGGMGGFNWMAHPAQLGW